jgi:hypothetical protein
VAAAAAFALTERTGAAWLARMIASVCYVTSG